jgi:hypothetical protein
MEVIGNEIAGNFTATSIRYRYERKSGGGGPGVGVKKVSSTQKLTVYPNPTTDKLTIDIPNYGENHVKLFSMDGKEVIVNSERTDKGIEVITTNVANGFYMLFAKSGNEMIWEKVQISR